MGYVGQGADRENYVWDGSKHLWVPSASYLWWGATSLNSITADGYFNAGQRAALALTTPGIATFALQGPLTIVEIAAATRAGTHPVDVTYIVELDGADSAFQMTVNAGSVSGVLTGVLSVGAGSHIVRMKFDASAVDTAVRRYVQHLRFEAEPQ